MRLKIHKEGKKILLTLFAAMVLINVIAFQYVIPRWFSVCYWG